MKGSKEYFEWLDAVHKATNVAKVQLFRMAMKDWAEKNGYPPPPEI